LSASEAGAAEKAGEKRLTRGRRDAAIREEKTLMHGSCGHGAQESCAPTKAGEPKSTVRSDCATAKENRCGEMCGKKC